jgi:hypothetical protein
MTAYRVNSSHVAEERASPGDDLLIALEEDTTLQAIMREAFNDMFRQAG